MSLSAQAIPVYQQWHTVTLAFDGPLTSESAAENPFTDYRLLVTFQHAETNYRIRGFYAADGNAANSGADSGSVWQVRFTPDRPGPWSYRAELRRGSDIAMNDDPVPGEPLELSNPVGAFEVIPTERQGQDFLNREPDFRSRGRLVADQGFFRFKDSGDHWLKGGANSPENFLAYNDFDGSYVAATSARDGEATRGDSMHGYAPHRRDWAAGDPTWGSGSESTELRGKSIIGAINYLSSEGMNAVYFLTLNIGGDGNDVWPYASPTEFDRFDVSKLEQWEVLFQHMQAKGVLLHLVTQETENERLLDDGNTGRLRKLYFQELIARFGHHLALIWNLGEENGPAEFSPIGQTDAQRAAMADYLAASDPYDHPIIIHTHSSASDKHHILGPLLGLKSLDGLSFQVDERERVNAEIREWKQLSREAGHEWLITMDEIGQWHTGALPDAEDPTHDSLRRHALWGAVLAGGAGVEWYFDAHYPANDLSSEDWRLRDRLWKQTRVALDFFADRPFWRYEPCDGLLPEMELTAKANEKSGEERGNEAAQEPKMPEWIGYCAGITGQEYVIYTPRGASGTMNLDGLSGAFRVHWFNPVNGDRSRDSVAQVQGGSEQDLITLLNDMDAPDQDLVIVLNKLQPPKITDSVTRSSNR